VQAKAQHTKQNILFISAHYTSATKIQRLAALLKRCPDTNCEFLKNLLAQGRDRGH